MAGEKPSISRDALIIQIMMFLFGALFAWGLTSRWGSAPPQSADWGNVADWAAAIGSVGAVIMALYNSNQAARHERERAKREDARDRAIAVSRAVAIDQELWMLGGEIAAQRNMIMTALESRQIQEAVRGVLMSLPPQPLPLLSKFVGDLRGLSVDDAATLMLALSGWDQMANPDRYSRFEATFDEKEAAAMLSSWYRGFGHLPSQLRDAREVTQRLMRESGHGSRPTDW